MKNIFGITFDDLETYFINNGDKKFRATQIYEFLYKKRVFDLDKMNNIPNTTKDNLKYDFDFSFIKIIKKQVDTDVKKYLFELADGNRIESVLMFHDYGTSLCVSSQVGCNMGCKFCESGRLKKVRDLETYEMVEQILLIEAEIKKRIDSVVIMGIGEPLDNYDNVLDFIKIINDPKGIAIGARHITISTCGLIPKIEALANEDIQFNLAISLHAPNTQLRSKIMPINKAFDLNLLIKTVKDYIKKTNRRVTIEYVMLDKVNDNETNAMELASLLKGMNVYVNLIPYNETNHIEYKRASKDTIMKFYDTLKKQGINVTIRKEFGSNIDAACGQLRSKEV